MNLYEAGSAELHLVYRYMEFRPLLDNHLLLNGYISCMCERLFLELHITVRGSSTRWLVVVIFQGLYLFCGLSDQIDLVCPSISLIIENGPLNHCGPFSQRYIVSFDGKNILMDQYFQWTTKQEQPGLRVVKWT